MIASRFLRLFWVGASLLFALHHPLDPARVAAQQFSQLPRQDHYLAKELFGAGQLAAAAEGFESALSRARRVGDKRWVDSIAPMVMLGECYYQQGNLAAAMEQYDAALTLALNNFGWIDQLDVAPEQLPFLEPVKNIGWFTKSSPSQALVVPEAVQIAVDPTQAQVVPGGAVTAPVSLVTRLDAAEVIQTMAIALRRRWQILGPLAPHSPLTAPLEKLFANTPQQKTGWIISSWRVLRGLSNLAVDVPSRDPLSDLRLGARISDQYDYFLSPLALLVLGEISAADGAYQAAIVQFQDASLLAAYFEQHGALSDAALDVAACGAASSRADLTEPLQQLASWSTKRSMIAGSAALIGAAELSGISGNMARAAQLSQQALSVLSRREVNLPRHRALLSLVRAQVAFGQNRLSLGKSALVEALGLMQGTAQTGAVVPQVFQTQMTLDLLASGALASRDAEAILARLLAEPTAVDWQLRPLQTLARLTTAALPAFERSFQLAAERNADPDELIVQMDRIQRQRFFELLPLGGRLLTWRLAVAADPQNLPQEARQSVARALALVPEAGQSLSDQNRLLEQLKAAPLPLDQRKVPAADKKLFNEFNTAVGRHELHLNRLSVQRIPLSRQSPTRVNPQTLKGQLKNTDLLLSFVTAGQQAFGVAITSDAAQIWRIANPDQTYSQLQTLCAEIGLRRGGNNLPPTVVNARNASWRSTAHQLYAALFPEPVRELIIRSDRLILSPSGRFWYVPFELLPSTDKVLAAPWVDQHDVTYVPTLGSLKAAFGDTRPANTTVGVVDGLFSPNREENAAVSQRIASATPASELVTIGQKPTPLSANWLRLRSDRLWVGSKLQPAINWSNDVVPLEGGQAVSWGSLLESPTNIPALMVLPAMSTSLGEAELQNGNEIFMPACALTLGGGSGALLSRWSVGGKSSADLVENFLVESRTTSNSEALRRSLLTMWAQQYLIAEEPALLPAGNEKAALCTGQHPLLWAGYMAIGDSAPLQK